MYTDLAMTQQLPWRSIRASVSHCSVRRLREIVRPPANDFGNAEPEVTLRPASSLRVEPHFGIR